MTRILQRPLLSCKLTAAVAVRHFVNLDDWNPTSRHTALASLEEIKKVINIQFVYPVSQKYAWCQKTKIMFEQMVSAAHGMGEKKTPTKLIYAGLKGKPTE